MRRVILPFVFDFPLCCPESEHCISVLGCADDLFEEIDFVTTDFSEDSSCEISVFSSLPEYSVKLEEVSLLEICGQEKLTEEKPAPCMPIASMYNPLRQFSLQYARPLGLHYAAERCVRIENCLNQKNLMLLSHPSLLTCERLKRLVTYT